MLGHLHLVVGSVRPRGVMVIAPPAGVTVVVPVVGVAVTRVMCVGLRSSQTERSHREQPGQKDRGYHAGPFMRSESSSHSVLVSQKPLKRSALMPPTGHHVPAGSTRHNPMTEPP
jgi:deoxyinosine 3'endonuclease (endonuclease V)